MDENKHFDSSEVSGVLNMKQILQESADSKNELGLQLVDIVASAVRRAFNGNLKQGGWGQVGGLIIKRKGSTPIVGLRLGSMLQSHGTFIMRIAAR
ncbi:MAG: DUF3800 domain-containing protein [Acidobacteriia bacterium]|nr:DUF3800 domain-containing protein [Terriglobia bacterium]